MRILYYRLNKYMHDLHSLISLLIRSKNALITLSDTFSVLLLSSHIKKWPDRMKTSLHTWIHVSLFSTSYRCLIGLSSRRFGGQIKTLLLLFLLLIFICIFALYMYTHICSHTHLSKFVYSLHIYKHTFLKCTCT